jgi:hypothetical protein
MPDLLPDLVSVKATAPRQCLCVPWCCRWMLAAYRSMCSSLCCAGCSPSARNGLPTAGADDEITYHHIVQVRMRRASLQAVLRCQSISSEQSCLAIPALLPVQRPSNKEHLISILTELSASWILPAEEAALRLTQGVQRVPDSWRAPVAVVSCSARCLLTLHRARMPTEKGMHLPRGCFASVRSLHSALVSTAMRRAKS